MGGFLVDGHKLGDNVWVYAFNRLGGKSGHFHNIKPSLAMLTCNGRLTSATLYKIKNGKATNELSKKEISLLNVRIADTYEEAVEKYNELIKQEADFYRSKLEQVESYLIC